MTPIYIFMDNYSLIDGLYYDWCTWALQMLINKNKQAQTDTRRLRLGIRGMHAELMVVVGKGAVIFCRSRMKWDETNTMTNLP